MRVDDRGFMLVNIGEDVLENRAAEGVQSGARQIENLPSANIRGFCVHHVPDVVDLDAFATLLGQCGNLIEVFAPQSDAAGQITGGSAAGE